MHIEDRTTYDIRQHRRYDLETGVALSIDGVGSGKDALEAVRDTADNAAAVIGRIVSVLAYKGLLDHSDVQFIVGGAFVVVGDE